jgi:hypothetical protein
MILKSNYENTANKFSLKPTAYETVIFDRDIKIPEITHCV